DLRHTTASLLLWHGVDMFAVQRILRHSDPKVTSERYAHTVRGYLHEAVDRLALAPAPAVEEKPREVAAASGFGAPVVRNAGEAAPGRVRSEKAGRVSAGLEWRARRDLNPQPSGSKPDALSN